MADNIFTYSINDGFLWSEVNLKGTRSYFIEGYASTIDEDKAGEIIDIDAQQDICNQMQGTNITMDIEHEEWYDENGKILQRPKNEKIPVAKIVSAELRPRGTWVKAEVNTNLNSFKQVWGSIKDGFLKAFSVAFYPTQKVGNIIKHLNLVNVTLTGSPVNPNATFAVSMKSASAWMDTIEVKAIAPKTPDGATPENPADTPEAPTIKNDETKEFECEDCDKEFKTTDALNEHKKTVHGKQETPEVKSMEPEIKSEIPVTETIVETESVEAIVKAMKEKQDAEMEAMKQKIASLKAELEKPVMKAIVPESMPSTKPPVVMISPLGLVR